MGWGEDEKRIARLVRAVMHADDLSTMFTIVAAQTRWHDRCQQQRREQTDKKRREDKTRRENKSDNMIHVCIHLRRRAAASGAGRPYILLFGRPQLGWIRRRRRTTASVDLCVCIFPLGRSLSRSSRIMLSINKEEGWALIQFERPTASAAAAAAAAPFLLWLFSSLSRRRRRRRRLQGATRHTKSSRPRASSSSSLSPLLCVWWCHSLSQIPGKRQRQTMSIKWERKKERRDEIRFSFSKS